MNATAALGAELADSICQQSDIIRTYTAYLDRFMEIAQSSPQTAELEELKQALAQVELLVPVIGNFSSGKTTLINTLISDSGLKLPTANAPETALATELHYGPVNKLYGVTKDGAQVSLGLESLGTQNYADYDHLRLEVHSETLRQLAPVILVDMPGFDSTHQEHDLAIYEYIHKGAHFVLLNIIKDGSLSSSIMLRLKELEALGRDFTVFLSKSDLVTAETAQETLNYVRSQLEAQFGYKVPATCINNTDNSEVLERLRALDPQVLCRQLFALSIDNAAETLKQYLQTKLDSAAVSKEKLEEAVQELHDSIAELKAKAENYIKDARRQINAAGIVAGVIDDLRSALENNLSIFVSSVNLQGGDQSSLNGLINDVVRSTLVSSLSAHMEDLKADICSDFSSSLSSLNKALSDLEIDKNFISVLETQVQYFLGEFLTSLTGVKTSGAAGSDKTGSVIAAAGTIAALALPIGPVLKVALGIATALLPGIFSQFLNKKQEENQRTVLENSLRNKVFPEILVKVKVQLQQTVSEQSDVLVQKIGEQYQQRLQQKSSSIEEAIAAKQQDAAQAEAQAGELTAQIKEIEEIQSKL